MDTDWAPTGQIHHQLGHNASYHQTSQTSQSPDPPVEPRERAPSISSIAPGGGSVKRPSISSVHSTTNGNPSLMDSGSNIHSNTITSPATSTSFHPLFSSVSGPSFIIPSPLSSSVCLFDSNSTTVSNPVGDAAPAAGGGSGPSSFDRNGSAASMSLSSVDSSPTTSVPYVQSTQTSTGNLPASLKPLQSSSPTCSNDAFLKKSDTSSLSPKSKSPELKFPDSDSVRVSKLVNESPKVGDGFLPSESQSSTHPVLPHRQMPTPASVTVANSPHEFHEGTRSSSNNPVSLPTPPTSSFSPAQHQCIPNSRSVSALNMHGLATRPFASLHQMYENDQQSTDAGVRSLTASLDIFNLSDSSVPVPGRSGSFNKQPAAGTDWSTSLSPYSTTVDSAFFASNEDEIQYLRHTPRRPSGFQDNPALGPVTGLGPPTVAPYDYQYSGQSRSATSPGSYYLQSPTSEYDQMIDTRIPCRFFMEGYCSRGDSCHYSHNVSNMPRNNNNMNPTSPASNNLATPVNGNGNELAPFMNDGYNPDRYKSGYSASTGFPTPYVNRTSEFPVIPRSVSSNLESTQSNLYANNNLRGMQSRASTNSFNSQSSNTGYGQQAFRSSYSRGSGVLGASGSTNSMRHGQDSRGLQLPADYIMYGSPTNPISGGYNNDYPPTGGMVQAMYQSPYGMMGNNPDMYGSNQGGYYSNDMQSMNPYQCGNKMQRGYHAQCLNNNSLVMNPNNINKLDMEARFAGLDLDSVKGQYPALAKDQHGCRFLQRKLEEGGCLAATAILDEVVTRFAELMTDPFGNYLCQKLLEHVSDPQKTSILEQVTPHLAFVSLNMHGTRAVQKLVEHVSTSEQAGLLVKALGRHTITLIKDLNGNHVIQKCLVRLPPNDAQFVYDSVTQGCVEVSTHRHGCCVIQRCLDYATTDQRRRLAAEITGHCLMLVKDPFGNYVVQYVLDMGDTTFVDAIAARLRGHVVMLSMQKFASNVMEKCIRVSSPDLRRSLISELFASKEVLDSLLRDGYANYVVQSCIDFIDMHQRTLLVERLAPLIPIIHNTPYGKRIMTKLNVVH